MSLDIQEKNNKDISLHNRDKNLIMLRIKGTALVFLAAMWKFVEDMEQSDAPPFELISLNCVL